MGPREGRVRAVSRLLGVLLTLLPLVPASAPAQAVVTLPLADNVGYLPRDLVVTAGAPVMLVDIDPLSSPDGAPHDLRSVKFRSNKNRPWCVNFPGTQKCPLIWSELINAGETTEVLGVGDLTEGVSYAFFCSYHSTMVGTITVRA